jgi:LysW-gamma-L-lysine carboxypeptidase
MDDARAIDVLEQAVAIPSPSGDERAVASFLAAESRRDGLAARVDATGNLVVEAGRGSTPSIMLLSHLDTAGEMLGVRRTPTTLEGRGTVDAKGPLVAMLAAAARLRDAPFHLVVIGAVEEETIDSRGAESLAGRWDVDCVVVGEPSGVDAVVLGYKGKFDVLVEVDCPPSHNAAPGATAVEELVDAWASLVALLEGNDRGRFWQPAAALTRLEGNATRARGHIDLRFAPGTDPRALVDDVTGRYPRLRTTVLGHYPAVVADRNNVVARALRSALRDHGLHPRTKLKTGTSDMNTVSKFWDVPMCAYGPGDSKLDHTDSERISLAEFTLGIAVLEAALPGAARELATSRHAGQAVHTRGG